MGEDCCSFHLISGDGVLNMEGLENFSRTTNLSQRGVSYAVVAIMGPQSGGKSTLLNKLFRTDFRMMDAEDGRTQTTQGIWMAKAIGIEPFIVAIDVEGSDSRERGQDGATFEKQSALFALAIADIVMINMWCHDIGREHAANRPLLKVVFEAMLRLFRARKTTLLFVIRDQTKTPFERLELSLSGDIEKIWAEIPKPDAYKGTPLGDFFKVEITALPNYEYEKDEFKSKVDRLRQRFFHSISPGGLAGDRKDVQPASGFSLRAEQIWKTIKENKDLDLPAMEVMVATFRCDRIAKETLNRLNSDEAWLALRKDVEARPAPNFRKNIRSILENTLSQYDMEAIHFKESIRDDKRKELEIEALQVLYPAYAAMLRHLRSRALKFFETRMIKMVKRATSDGLDASIDSIVQQAMDKFEKESRDVSISKEWDASEVRENLRFDIETTKYRAKTKFYKVDRLRQQFFYSISPGGLAGDRKDVQSASGFVIRAEKIWKTIKENKDLDLPAMEVMVATVRCDQIAKETLSRLELDETWLAMGEALKSSPVSEFGEKLSSILENYLCQYDKEAINHEESIRNENRRKLEAKALKVVRPAYAAMLQHLRSIALKSLQTRLETTVKEASGDGFEAAVDSCCQSIMRKFERGCEDATIRQVNDWVCLEENVRESLRRDMETLKSEKKAEYEELIKAQKLRRYPTVRGSWCG